MKNVKALAILISLTCLPVAAQADDHKPGTQREQFSYALGFQIGSQIGQQIMAEGVRSRSGVSRAGDPRRDSGK